MNKYLILFGRKTNIVMFLAITILTTSGCGSISYKHLKSTYTRHVGGKTSAGKKIVFAHWTGYAPAVYAPRMDVKQTKRFNDPWETHDPLAEDFIQISAERKWGNIEIYSADIADRNNREKWTNLTNNPSHDGSPTLSSDGKTIAFCSLRDGTSQIYTMDIDGNNIKKITDTTVNKMNPQWFNNDTKILFMTRPKNFRAKPENLLVNSDGTGEARVFDQYKDDPNLSTLSPEDIKESKKIAEKIAADIMKDPKK